MDERPRGGCMMPHEVPMKFTRIDSRSQCEDFKKKLREACAKANSELSQKELRKLIENAKRTKGDAGF